MPLKQPIGAYCGGKPSLYLRLYSPHHRLRRSCLAQVDLVLRSAILHRKCKIAKLMCAQKPHRGYLHNAHIRPEGEASLKGSALAINYGKRRHCVMPFPPQFARPALLRKSEPMGLNCCQSHRRGKPNTKPKATVGFSSTSRDFFSSVRKEICEPFISFSSSVH